MSFHSRQMLVTLAFAASLWPSSALSEPLAVFSPTEHDFGGVRRGEKVARTFQLRNGGDASLELTGVRFSMPGMTARLPGTVAPGADATIELELTTDHVQGRARGVAVVETNDPRARSVSLVLTGMVHGPVDIEPLPAVFLSSFRGEDVRRELTVRSKDRKSTRLNSSHTVISYAVFCLKKKKQRRPHHDHQKQPYELKHTYHHNRTQRPTYENT